MTWTSSRSSSASTSHFIYISSMLRWGVQLKASACGAARPMVMRSAADVDRWSPAHLSLSPSSRINLRRESHLIAVSCSCSQGTIEIHDRCRSREVTHDARRPSFGAVLSDLRLVIVFRWTRSSRGRMAMTSRHVDAVVLAVAIMISRVANHLYVTAPTSRTGLSSCCSSHVAHRMPGHAYSEGQLFRDGFSSSSRVINLRCAERPSAVKLPQPTSKKRPERMPRLAPISLPFVRGAAKFLSQFAVLAIVARPPVPNCEALRAFDAYERVPGKADRAG